MKSSTTFLACLLFAKYHESSSENFDFDAKFIANKYFIDKTDMLTEMFLKGGLPYRYIMSPHGFGKSTNLAMVRKFSQIELDKNYNPVHWIRTTAYGLFKHLKIGMNDYILTTHLARYPVIFINMSSAFIDEMFTERIISAMNELIYQPYKDYEWLLDFHEKNRTFSKLTEDDIDFMHRALNKHLTPSQIMESLNVLSKILFNHFNKESIVLIDDLDKILMNSFINSQREVTANKYFVKLISLTIDGIFENERNNYVGYGLLVGVSGLLFSISDVSIKEVLVYTHRFLEENKFSPYFGFTQKDVERLCKRHRCNKTMLTILQENFNGYETDFKRYSLYNPNSIVKYFQSSNNSVFPKPQIYWRIPEHETFIGRFLIIPPYLEKISQLFLGAPISFHFKRYHHFSFVFDLLKMYLPIIHTDHVDTLLTFLFEQGLLTALAYQQHEQALYILPNNQVREIFFDQLLQFYDRKGIRLETISECFTEVLQITQDHESITSVTQKLQDMLASPFENLQLVEDSEYSYCEEPAESLFQAVIYAALLNNGTFNASTEVLDRFVSSPHIVFTIGNKLGIILLRYRVQSVEIPIERAMKVYKMKNGIDTMVLIGINIVENGIEVTMDFRNGVEIEKYLNTTESPIK